MKLTPAQVERTLEQFEAQAVPESHPALPELTGLFGEHTFFLDAQGLSIVELVSADGGETGHVVNLANWADANWTKLAPHEPERTDIAIKFAA